MSAPRLQLRLSQQLKLAPQLRQAIALLQLSRLELKEHIQEVLDANPLLERADQPDTDGSAGDTGEGETFETGEDRFDEWSDLPEGFSAAGTGVGAEEFAADKSADSLTQHLLWQLNLSHFSATDEAIAKAIIFALDDDGYLHDDLDTLRASVAPEFLVDRDEVAAVLNRIQHFEPVGVASRNLGECLSLQLAVLPGNPPWRGLAERIVERHLDLLGRQDLSGIARTTGFDDDAVAAAVKLIRSLNPRPGARFGSEDEQYIVPDVYVHPAPGSDTDAWRITLNPDNDPQLRLNGYYTRLARQARGEDAKYMKARLQEARWLISGLELRNNTLLSVTRAIFERQRDFLTQGEAGIKPLVQREIAEIAGVHESTVSRATTRKYAYTPRGTFELKHFFSSSVPAAGGGEISAAAARARIRQLVADEPPGKPLSDQGLSDTLSAEGVLIARRTVAKYREQLGIPTSTQRKRMHRMGGKLQK